MRLFAVAGDAFFGRTTLVTEPSSPVIVKQVNADLSVQDAAGLVVVLPLADAPTSCVQRAVLRLDVREAVGEALLGVYPGAAVSLVEGRLPPTGADDAARLLDNRPRGTAVVTAPGPVEVDITSLYLLWAKGAAFPSQGRYVRVGTPLVLVLRPTAADAGIWRLGLGGRPAVRYGTTAGCT